MSESWAEKAMAPHSNTLAWEIPWTEEPGRLQAMGSRSIRHDWATSLSLFTFTHWRRKWRPTPVFLPGESQGREPGGLPSMGSHRVGHDWSDLAAAAESLGPLSPPPQLLVIHLFIMKLTTENKTLFSSLLLFCLCPSKLEVHFCHFVCHLSYQIPLPSE